MQAELQATLSHTSLNTAEKAAGQLSDQQRELISDFEQCSFKRSAWRHERVQSDGEVIDAFTIERDGRQFIAARNQAVVQRAGKERTVENFIVAEISEGTVTTAVHRHQIAARLCAQVWAGTLIDEELPNFAYPKS